MKQEQVKSILKLFKSYILEENRTIHSTEVQLNQREKLARNGITFTNLLSVSEETIDEAIELFGKKPEEWNQTFHKSFKTVLETPIEELVAQQIIHYFTTYGLESLGLYDQSLVYIPHKQLDIPELEEDIPLIVIQGITEEQLKEKLMILLTSSIALSKETINDIMNISDYINLDMVDEVKNKEVRIALYEKYNIVPRNNLMFLRWLIKKITGETLLIKNKDLIKKIKDYSDTHELWAQLNGYVCLTFKYDPEKVQNEKYSKLLNLETNKIEVSGYIKMSEIFLRYKDLFLAMKRKEDSEDARKLNKIINKLDKLARVKGYHEPIGEPFLNRITSIKDTSILELVRDDLCEELDKVTIFKEISIVNALRYRELNNESILYKVRNGKAYAKTRKLEDKDTQWVISRALDLVYGHLKKRVNKLLCGKTVYLPEYIELAAPTSEKQYIGYLPYGTVVKVPRIEDMLVGVHWFNFDNERVDLDIHTLNFIFIKYK